MNSKKKKLIAYDLDGTLVDTRTDIVLGINFMLRELGLPERTPKEIRGYVGWGLHDLVGKATGSSERDLIERGGRLFRHYYDEHMMDHTCLYEGAREMLDFFRGRIQAVITNKPNPFSENMLKDLGVAGYLSDVIAGGAGTPRKPDPASFLELLEKHGVAPAEALYIGDSGIDIETGRRAGVETVVMTHGFTDKIELQSLNPNGLVHDFRELKHMAEERGW